MVNEGELASAPDNRKSEALLTICPFLYHVIPVAVPAVIRHSSMTVWPVVGSYRFCGAFTASGDLTVNGKLTVCGDVSVSGWVTSQKRVCPLCPMLSALFNVPTTV